MTSNARAGRRRRLLQDGGGATATIEMADAAEEAPTPRYAPRGGSVSFAVAAGLLPRSAVSLAATFFVLVGVTAALVAADRYRATLTAAAPGLAQADYVFAVGQPASLGAWWATALWFAMAVLCFASFGLRRSRMDDLRCAYRWWLVGGVACLAMSANAATHAHRAVASIAAAATGFSPLAGDAFWWLAPGALVLGGLALRLVVDLAFSRVALLFAVGALGVGTVSWAVDAGFLPSAIAGVSPWLAAPLLGPTLSLSALVLSVVSLLCLSRRILLEAEGVVAPPVAKPAKAPATSSKPTASKPAPATTAKATATRATAALRTAEPAAETPATPRPKRAATVRAAAPPAEVEAAPKPEEPTAWVSGGDDYQDEYDDKPQRRKLSKSERKRLRKQKARRAA